jgi:uncharacterized membrane protein (DUF441 family)
MVQDNLLLLVIMTLGLVFNNNLVAAGAGSLLVLKLAKFHTLLQLLERRALDVGLLFLLVAVLAPFSLDKVGVKDIWLIGGVTAAYVCGQGMVLLQVQSEIVVGLVVGTVIGVSLLRGIPVGPLAAAGVTALLFNLIGLGKR